MLRVLANHSIYRGRVVTLIVDMRKRMHQTIVRLLNYDAVYRDIIRTILNMCFD